MNPSGKVKFMYVEGETLPANADKSTIYIVGTTPKTLYIGSDQIGGSGDLELDVTLDKDFDDNQVYIDEKDVPFVDAHPSKITFKKFAKGLFDPFPSPNMNIVPFDNLTPMSGSTYWSETHYNASGSNAEWNLQYNTDPTNNEWQQWFYLRPMSSSPSIEAYYDVLLCDHVQDFIEDGAWIYLGIIGGYSSSWSSGAYYSVVLEDESGNRIGLDNLPIDSYPNGIIGFQYHSSYTKLRFELSYDFKERDYVIGIGYCTPGDTEPDIDLNYQLKKADTRPFNVYTYDSGFSMTYEKRGEDSVNCNIYNTDINISNYTSESVGYTYPYCYNFGTHDYTVYSNSALVFNLSDKKLYYVPSGSDTLELATFSDGGIINIEKYDGSQMDIDTYNSNGLSNIYNMSSYSNILAYNPSNADEVAGATAYCLHYNKLMSDYYGTLPHYSVVYDMENKRAYEECLFIPQYYSSLSYLLQGKSFITGSGSETATAGDSVLIIYSGIYVDYIHPHALEYIDVDINWQGAKRYTEDLCKAFTIYSTDASQYFSCYPSSDADYHVYAEYSKLADIATKSDLENYLSIQDANEDFIAKESDLGHRLDIPQKVTTNENPAEIPGSGIQLDQRLSDFYVDFYPNQDKHGFEAPSYQGNYKNKLHLQNISTQTVNGITLTFDSTYGTISLSGTSTSAYTTVIKLSDSLVSAGLIAGTQYSMSGAQPSNGYYIYLEVKEDDDPYTAGEYDQGSGISSYTVTANTKLFLNIRKYYNTTGTVIRPMAIPKSWGFPYTYDHFVPWSNESPIYARSTTSPTYVLTKIKNGSRKGYVSIYFSGTTNCGAEINITKAEAYIWKYISSYNGEPLPQYFWISSREPWASGGTPSIGAQVAYLDMNNPLTPTMNLYDTDPFDLVRPGASTYYVGEYTTSTDPNYPVESESIDNYWCNNIDEHCRIYADYQTGLFASIPMLDDYATKDYVDSEIEEHEYTLPVASDTTLGGVKIGDNLSIDANGVLSGEDPIQLSTMPAASTEFAGRTVQFVGTTDDHFTHGYFYECVDSAHVNKPYLAPDGNYYAYRIESIHEESGTYFTIYSESIPFYVANSNYTKYNGNYYPLIKIRQTGQGFNYKYGIARVSYKKNEPSTAYVWYGSDCYTPNTLDLSYCAPAPSNYRIFYKDTTEVYEGTFEKICIDLTEYNNAKNVWKQNADGTTFTNITDAYVYETTVRGGTNWNQLEVQPAPAPYTLPVASDSTLGGVKIGDNLSIDENGVLSGEAPIQVSNMPFASAEFADRIVQFVGTTNANYTNGYFYKCVQGEISAAIEAPDGQLYRYYYQWTYANGHGWECWSDEKMVALNTNYSSVYANQLVFYGKSGVQDFDVHGLEVSNSSRTPYTGFVNINNETVRIYVDDLSGFHTNSVCYAIQDNGSGNVTQWMSAEDAKTYLSAPSYVWTRVDAQPAPAPYELPTSTASTLGGVKIGDNVNVDANGVISVAAPTSIKTVNSVSIGTVTTETEIASFPFYPTSVGNGDALIINGLVSGSVALTGSAAEITIKVKLDETDYFTFKQTCDAGYVTIPVTCSIPMTSPAANHVATVTVTVTDGSITL